MFIVMIFWMIAMLASSPAPLFARETLVAQLSGRILLAVEEHGEAWYVDPVTLRRVFLGRPEDAFRLLQTYGLGITSRDLATIPIADTPTIAHSVPFVAQAPLGDWSDERQAEGCEEASVIMAVAWARHELLSSHDALQKITTMSDWEREQYGTYVDTSIDDTANRLLKEYEKYSHVMVQHDITADDVRDALHDGVVIVAVKGQLLHNPHYVGIGPLRHTLLVTGYDPTTDEFITNDPGTQYGEGYRYSRATLSLALGDYPSGDHLPVISMPTAMIVIMQ